MNFVLFFSSGLHINFWLQSSHFDCAIMLIFGLDYFFPGLTLGCCSVLYFLNLKTLEFAIGQLLRKNFISILGALGNLLCFASLENLTISRPVSQFVLEMGKRERYISVVMYRLCSA